LAALKTTKTRTARLPSKSFVDFRSHRGDNRDYYTVGRCRNATTQVTETRMKSAVKTKAKNTNNQASFGMSLLKHNQNVEAAMELSRHLDEKGVH